jgi:Domain of unknown function (DUF5615)
MPVNLYMDVHVPLTVTHQLRRRGIDVLTAIDDASGTLDDESLLVRATQLKRLIVTQDIRFQARAVLWQQQGRHFSGMAFAHQLSITIGRFVLDLELIAKACADGECDDQIFHLPLSTGHPHE